MLSARKKILYHLQLFEIFLQMPQLLIYFWRTSSAMRLTSATNAGTIIEGALTLKENLPSAHVMRLR